MAGNFVPPTQSSTLGTPGNQWAGGYFKQLNVGGNEIKGAAIAASRVGESGSSFFRMASGLTVMWGSEYNTATTDGRITFPVSFLSNSFSVTVNADGGTSSTRTIHTKNMTKTGFEYQKTDAQTGVRWIAVGI